MSWHARSPNVLLASQNAYLGKPALTKALQDVGRISAPSNKTPAERIVSARQILVQMQSAPMNRLTELLDSAIAELQD